MASETMGFLKSSRDSGQRDKRSQKQESGP